MANDLASRHHICEPPTEFEWMRPDLDGLLEVLEVLDDGYSTHVFSWTCNECKTDFIQVRVDGCKVTHQVYPLKEHPIEDEFEAVRDCMRELQGPLRLN